MNNVSLVKNIRHYLNTNGELIFSRRRAHSIRKKIIKQRGYKVVDKKKISELKSYAREQFGSSFFWPWLAVFTEIKGEFKEGWLADDFYSVILLNRYNPESLRISEYKTFDSRMFPDFAVKPILSKIGPNYFDGDHQKISSDKAEDMLYKYNKEVVVKEDLGLGGHNVEFIDSKDINLNRFANITSYVIQPIIKQHPSFAKLSPNAVSTVRVFTYLSEDGKISVKFTYYRFGMGESRVDNTSSGGGFCFVDSDGSIADMAYNKLGLEISTKHPDTQIPFSSVIVPKYKEILDKCVKSHKSFPYIRFIGWDVTIDQSEGPVLLEWNSTPQLWTCEALHGPFFKDEFNGKDHYDFLRVF